MDKQNTNLGKQAILGLQHLLAMYSGAVAVPMLIGTALHFNLSLIHISEPTRRS